MANPKLNILLLGPPLVTLDGKPVKINRRQPRALLYYLASQVQPSTRGEMCNLFWPTQSEAIARKNLREAISHLRQDLGVADGLIASNDQLSLNPENTYSDIVEFRKSLTPFLLMQDSPTGSSEPLEGWMVAQFLRAMALCRTPQFMQGVRLSGSAGFENWVELTNRTYNFAMIKVIDSLSDYYISTGDLDGALVWLRKGLDIEPLNFGMNYLTLTCLRDTGRIQQLIDFVNFQENLFKEHETLIPAQFLEIRARAVESREITVEIPASTWPVVNQADPEFMGRQEELAVLNRLMRRKGILHLRGEAGTGKTRLIKEFFSEQPYAPRLFYCQAHQLAFNLPFLTLIEGLEKMISPADWELIEEKDREILSQFFYKQLQNSASPFSPESGPGWEPLMQDIFYALLKLMEKVALKRPVLFVLDDAWWSDTGSLTLLGFLIAKNYFQNFGLLIIITCLEKSNEPLNQLILKLKRLKKLETLTLTNYAQEETGKFIQMMTGVSPNPSLLQKLQFTTGGNPFFLVECVRAMKTSHPNINAFMEKDPYPIPESIEALVWEKVNTLNPTAVKTLHAAAVLGNWFTPDVLEMMVMVDGESYLAALEEIKWAGFISVDMGIKPAGGYTFCHDMEREIIVRSLDPARRRDLHLKAAAAIIDRRGQKPELAANIARHFQAAGEPIRAVEYWLIAGRHARLHFTREDAYISYGQALALISQNPHLFIPETIYQVSSEWGFYTLDQGDHVACEQVYQTCLEIGEERHDPLLVGTGLSGLGRMLSLKSEVEKARQCYHQAIDHLKQTDHFDELTLTYSRLGNLCFMTGDILLAKEVLETGLEIKADRADSRLMEARINVSTLLCIILCLMGYPKRANELAQQMLIDSQHVTRHSAGLQANVTLAYTQSFSGQMAEAIRTCQSIRQLLDKLNIRLWNSMVDTILARSNLALGHFDEAWTWINLAVEREKEYPHEMVFDWAMFNLGDIYRILGQNEEAAIIYQSVIDKMVINFPNIDCYHSLGLSQISLGRKAEGLNNIDVAVSLAHSKGLEGNEFNAKMSRLIYSDALVDLQEEEQAKKGIAEMQTRGVAYADAYAVLIPARAAELRGENGIALENYIKMSEIASAKGTAGFEFFALNKVIRLAGRKSLQEKNARERVKQIFNHLSRNAQTQPVLGMFRKFRIKWRQNQ